MKKTLEGVFIGKKLEVSHFKIFGNIAYCHVPSERCIELDQIATLKIDLPRNRTSGALRCVLHHHIDLLL